MEFVGPIRQKKHFRKNHFEQLAWGQKQLICGLDEVGRGCLAGPVVTAAVILPLNKTSPLLKDSKLMTPEERLKAYHWIEKNCQYGVGIVHHRLIDRHNIWHATLIAMKRALLNLLSIAPERPSAIVIDAMPLQLFDTSYKDIPVYYFPFGERKSSSIAAASIVAKVCRDALMMRAEEAFPGFYLGQHKGYGTPLHKRIIIQSKTELVIHRKSFLKQVYAGAILDEAEEQISLLEVESSQIIEQL
jgi:ribonuclease HII